jgi:lipoic acid synthetase
VANEERERLPEWFRVRLPAGPTVGAMNRRLRRLGLHTVCEEARCPNQGECWGHGTATVLILGDTCTRACRFCAVTSGHPGGVLDGGEPARVAAAVRDAGLSYVVLTSVDRDDLPDGGAGHFAATVRAVREAIPSVRVEVLIPDYLDDRLRAVQDAGPDVLGHNVEVVRRLTPKVRDRRASYDRSLEVLRQAAAMRPDGWTKSSLMVGLGEDRDEVIETLRDLRGAGVRLVTLGQYLRPTLRHFPVARYWTPAEFEDLEREARAMGFDFVASGPKVRSSYRAAELFVQGRLGGGV